MALTEDELKKPSILLEPETLVDEIRRVFLEQTKIDSGPEFSDNVIVAWFENYDYGTRTTAGDLVQKVVNHMFDRFVKRPGSGYPEEQGSACSDDPVGIRKQMELARDRRDKILAAKKAAEDEKKEASK